MQEAKLTHLQEIFDPRFWKSKTNYNIAGKNLIEEINDLQPNLVIDAGCGHNVFKHKIKNLIGFDIVNFPNADFISSIQDAKFENESADVVIALGSVQFGTKQEVYSDMSKIISWVKPGGHIVMRAIKDQILFGPLGNKPAKYRYYWTDDDINFLTEYHNLSVIKGPEVEETLGKNNEVRGHRLVWWWRKNG